MLEDLSVIRDLSLAVTKRDRSALRLTGDQALWFLDQLVTNRVEDLAEGSATEALLLTPKGRIVTSMRILNVGEEVLVDLPSYKADQVAAFFGERVFTTRVAIEPSPFVLALDLFGAESPGVVASLVGEGAPVANLQVIRSDAVVVLRIERPLPGFSVWLERPTEGMDAAESVDPDVYDSLHTAVGVPQFGRDFDETFLPQEAALERMVHFNKGCYLGQEAVAMAQRGRVKRRLRHLRFVGRPEEGSLVVGDDQVGLLTHIAILDGQGFGVAAVSTTVAPGETVKIGKTQATVDELPGTVQGPAVPSARELRERLTG